MSVCLNSLWATDYLPVSLLWISRLRQTPGLVRICPVCTWEDDVSQLNFPLMAGGANRPSLAQAQRNFASLGAKDELVTRVRKPLPDECREERGRPSDVEGDAIASPNPMRAVHIRRIQLTSTIGAGRPRDSCVTEAIRVPVLGGPSSRFASTSQHSSYQLFSKLNHL